MPTTLVPHRLAMGAVLSTLHAAAVPGQATLGFEAPVVLDNLPNGPTTIVPLRGLRVTAFFEDPSTQHVWLQALVTDANGRVPIPTGHVARTAFVNLRGVDLTVYRPYVITQSPLYWTRSTPTIAIDYQIHPGVVDITTIPIGSAPTPTFLTVTECTAYYHLEAARRELQAWTGTWPTTLAVEFTPGSVAGAAYNYALDSLSVVVPGGDPAGSLHGRSKSVLCHEYGHRVWYRITGTSSPGFLNEAFADYLSSTWIGSPMIGAGITTQDLPRNIDVNAMFTPNRDPDPHHAGMPTAAALFHTRAAMPDPVGFDQCVRSSIARLPGDESALLLGILYCDDDDADLRNGTPNAAILYRNFTARHGIPWPVSRSSTNLGTGFGGQSPTASPRLDGSFAQNALHLSMMGLPASAFGMLIASGPTAEYQQFGPGEQAFVALAAPLAAQSIFSSGTGTAVMSLPASTATTGFGLVFQAAFFGGAGSYGVAATNGVFTQF